MNTFTLKVGDDNYHLTTKSPQILGMWLASIVAEWELKGPSYTWPPISLEVR